MNKHPLRQFLESNFAQRRLKNLIDEEYEAYSDAEIEDMIKAEMRTAENSADAELASWLDDRKGLSRIIRTLPWDQFFEETYDVQDLVTPLWVSDLPHEIAHGDLRDVLEFARVEANANLAPLFLQKVQRLKRLPETLKLPVLVVEPSRYQRSARAGHPVDPDRPGISPLCTVPYLKEGKAYIEDGNHRAVARLLLTGRLTLNVLRFTIPETQLPNR